MAITAPVGAVISGHGIFMGVSADHGVDDFSNH